MSSASSRAPLLFALLAVACERSPSPPSPGPSASSGAPPAASSSPQASASAVAVPPPNCADWTMDGKEATGSLEHWCRAFGPCPKSLQEGVAKIPLRPRNIDIHGKYRTVRSGWLGGLSYTFESDRLVGAHYWNDVSFGSCADRGVVRYTGGLAAPSSKPDTSCGVVPGRDYTSGEACRCNVEAPTPTLANGNQGPTLRTSLECLYEVKVAAHICRATLQEQREVMARQEKEAKALAETADQLRGPTGTARPTAAEIEQLTFRSSERAECGGTVITSPFLGARAACRYDAEGALTGLRWGKRYESEGFAVCQQTTTERQGASAPRP